MSAFLGKIHYWLYNKIQLHEDLIDDVLAFAKGKGYDIEMLLNESYSRYGSAVKGQLENEIDHSNIHGWLQDRIKSVESRLAYIITELINNNVIKKEDGSRIFYENGAKTMEGLDLERCSPQDVFNLIFDHMLEGMPCDRVNEVIENGENTIQWRTLRDIHKNHWDSIGGDVNNFYLFRESWINGFLDASNTGYKYFRYENGLNEIKIP